MNSSHTEDALASGEAGVRAVLLKHLRGFRVLADVVCEVADGSASWAGPVHQGLLQRTTRDVNEVLCGGASVAFYKAIATLRDQSKALDHGPWYRCSIHLSGRQVSFAYDWEGAPYASIKDLPPTLDGRTPSFVLRDRFDQALVDELSDTDLANCLLFYVPAHMQKGLPVSPPLMEVFATLEWQTDVNNGAMDQYFARDLEPMTGLSRAALYGYTWLGLKKLQCPEAADLFAESIGLYAHFHPRVEAARIALGIDVRPMATESDIMSRYYAMASNVEEARLRYLRQNAKALEQ